MHPSGAEEIFDGKDIVAVDAFSVSKALMQS